MNRVNMTCNFRNEFRWINKDTREIAAQIWNNMGSDECFYCNGNQSVNNKSSIIIEKFHLPTKYSNKFMESFSIDKSKYTCHVQKDCVNRHKIALLTILRIIEIGNIIMDKYVELCVLYPNIPIHIRHNDKYSLQSLFGFISKNEHMLDHEEDVHKHNNIRMILKILQSIIVKINHTTCVYCQCPKLNTHGKMYTIPKILQREAWEILNTLNVKQHDLICITVSDCEYKHELGVIMVYKSLKIISLIHPKDIEESIDMRFVIRQINSARYL